MNEGAARCYEEGAMMQVPGSKATRLHQVAAERHAQNAAAGPVYVAEVQGLTGTRDRKGDAANVAGWLAAWQGPAARSVAVYRIEPSGDWALVDMRATRGEGTVPADYRGDWRRDPVWDAAVGAA